MFDLGAFPAGNAQHGQRRFAVRELFLPSNFRSQKAVEIDLLAQRVGHLMHFGCDDQPHQARLDPFEIADCFRRFFGAPFGRHQARGAHGSQQGLDLALQERDIPIGDRMRRLRSQSRECQIFQPLAHPDQPGEAHSVEVLGQAIDGYGEFDEAIERSGIDVVVPTRSQDMDTIIYDVRARGCHGDDSGEDRAL